MKNLCGEKKIKKHTLSYIDIASLKLTWEKEYNVMLSCQMTL
jgi:hypothetical protein